MNKTQLISKYSTELSKIAKEFNTYLDTHPEALVTRGLSKWGHYNDKVEVYARITTDNELDKLVLRSEQLYRVLSSLRDL